MWDINVNSLVHTINHKFQELIASKWWRLAELINESSTDKDFWGHIPKI